MIASPSWWDCSVPPRGVRSWVVWGSELLRARQVAAKLGRPAAELVAWLRDHAPDAGGQAGGRRIRWATQTEAERAEAAEAAEPLPAAQVLMVGPDGVEKFRSLAGAARRLRRGDRQLSPRQLLELLELGSFTVDGWTLSISEPGRSPPPPPADDPDDEDFPMAATTQDQPQDQQQALEQPPERSRGGRKRGQTLVCNGRLFGSQGAVAAYLGVQQSRISSLLRRHPEGVEINGVLVRPATDADAGLPQAEPQPQPRRKARAVTVNGTTHPDLTTAAKAHGRSWTSVKRLAEGDLTEPGLQVAYADAGGDRIQPQVLSPALLALLQTEAGTRGISIDALVLDLLPVSDAVRAVLGAVPREVLGQLSEQDWQRLRLMAAAG